jgi:hypothetical protein
MTGPRVSERWTPLPGCNCGCWETFPAEASAVPEGLRDVERVLDWAEAAAAPGSVLRQQVIAARAALAATPAKAEGLDTGNECLAVIEPDEAIHFCLLPEGHSGEHRTALQLDEERLVAAAIRLNERETLLDGRTIETIARQLAAAYRADTATEGEDR